MENIEKFFETVSCETNSRTEKLSVDGHENAKIILCFWYVYYSDRVHRVSSHLQKSMELNDKQSFWHFCRECKRGVSNVLLDDEVKKKNKRKFYIIFLRNYDIACWSNSTAALTWITFARFNFSARMQINDAILRGHSDRNRIARSHKRRNHRANDVNVKYRKKKRVRRNRTLSLDLRSRRARK